MSPYSVPIFGPLAWIDVVLLGWFALTAASVVWIAWDVFTKTPENTVIKWAWVLTSRPRNDIRETGGAHR